ncbi:MAG: DUF4430 domain-containing protein [candidate division Zixibacteria bacterium]|nr:DUF4430 domain-containing protein [candidate division Zixibacteria bacterium]
MNRCRLFLTVGCLCVATLLSGVFCNQKSESEAKQTRKAADESTSLSDPRDSLVIELTGVDSRTVFDLLTERHRVIYVSSAQGVFVKEIDSVENSYSHAWIYSVNGESGTVACNAYVTNDGDVIKWHFRRLGN